MSDRQPKFLLADIINSAEKIISYTETLNFDDFAADNKTIDAVVRNFEIIGEAANRLPDEFKDKHSLIDWHKMRELRNRMIHHYFGIDYEIIWSIKENYLPDLIIQISQILNHY